MKLLTNHLLPSALAATSIHFFCSSAVISAQPLVSCTKSKNNGGILLYGNADWVGGWIEVYADTNPAGAMFNLMFEMDCDACDVATCRTFDFNVTKGADTVYSFVSQEIEYQHYLSSAIDHSIFSMDPIGPFDEGEYEYCIESFVDGQPEASACGTLSSLMDSTPPEFTSEVDISPASTVAPGTELTLSVGVSDDALLDYMNVNVNGEYNQRIGLKTQGNKVSPDVTSATFSYTVPSQGKTEDKVFDLTLCDTTSKCATKSETVFVVKEGGGGGGGGGNGRGNGGGPP
eukprot:CAMPEP_0183731876 /NCGR_PEP_ID=MMETSP0737-20130205/36710_1 /TAXON_ID=385413 /ORGANISM="Thalassiosira miniscula, Strain CCMP1093" /LENGTH=287 /DNA_ID=CAMNT_0025964721 /DNA_START=46 /DNA_END=909 /DNA_ORIENTATION=-